MTNGYTCGKCLPSAPLRPAFTECAHDIYLTRIVKKNVKFFSEEVIDYMKQRIWEGNIRELENFVERLVTLTKNDDSTINADSFPDDLKKELDQFRENRKYYSSESLKKKVRNFEAEIIKKTLTECNWNRSETARRLETSEKNIRYKIATLNIKKTKNE